MLTNCFPECCSTDLGEGRLLKTQSEGRIGLCVPLSLACSQLLTESVLPNGQPNVPKSSPVTSNHIWRKAQNLPQGPRRPGKIWSLPINCQDSPLPPSSASQHTPTTLFLFLNCSTLPVLINPLPSLRPQEPS